MGVFRVTRRLAITVHVRGDEVYHLPGDRPGILSPPSATTSNKLLGQMEGLEVRARTVWTR